jgi:hypothetical protein
MPPDERDTDPDLIAVEAPDADDPREAPTRPDLFRLKCPRCRGEGRVLETFEAAGRYRAVARLCPFCGGTKTVDRRQLAEMHATGQGRPPRNPGSGGE